METVGANQKFQKTDVKIRKLPEQFSEKISSQFLTENPVLQTTSEIQVQCEINSEKTSEQLSKLYIWKFLVKVIRVLNAFPVRFYNASYCQKSNNV